MIISTFLANLLINSSIITFCGLLLLKFERFFYQKTYYWSWLAILLKSLCIYRIDFLSTRFNPIPDNFFTLKTNAPLSGTMETIVSTPSDYFQQLIYNRIASAIFIIWLFGFLFYILIAIYRYVSFIRNTQNEKIHTSNFEMEILERAKREMRIKANVSLVSSHKITTPTLTGYLKYKIIVPLNFFEDYSAQECTMVLSHELQHIKRFDLMINVLTILSSAIHWFNPIFRIILQKIKYVQEQNCDASTCDFYSDLLKKSYCKSLIKFLENANITQDFPNKMCFINNFTETKRRISVLLNPEIKTKFGKILNNIFIIILLSLCGITGMAFSKNDTTPETLKCVGNNNAKVTIVEFGDYQCPFCSNISPIISNILAKYKSNVKWVFKDLPLEFHPNAFPAALVANCAALQNKFKEAHTMLMENQANLNEDLYLKIANNLHLNLIDFNNCRSSNDTKKLIYNSIKEAKQAKINGTPTLIINGKVYSGAMSESDLSNFIDNELNNSMPNN